MPSWAEKPRGSRNLRTNYSVPEVQWPPLDPGLVSEVMKFLEQSGGGCDHGKFSRRFHKVKKRQLDSHFEFSGDTWGQRIELPENQAFWPVNKTALGMKTSLRVKVPARKKPGKRI